ncbi:TPA: leukocidin family pore-forming toxin [Bacillus tropicus]|nr:leukocidin family pore-forming toxin [Bacillus tropicus]
MEWKVGFTAFVNQGGCFYDRNHLNTLYGNQLFMYARVLNVTAT